MAKYPSDEDVKRIISKELPRHRIIQIAPEPDADSDAEQCEAVSPDIDEMLESVRGEVNAHELRERFGSDNVLNSILSDEAGGMEEAANSDDETVHDRLVTVEPSGARRLSDSRSNIKSVIISGETGDIDVSQG
jgi:hypothetical protein